MNWLTEKDEIFLTCRWCLSLKKSRKRFFSQWSNSLWKRNLKYPNSWYQFLWAQIFAGKICSTRPQNFGGLKWREIVKRKHGYMWSFEYPLNSSYKYAKKVKLNPNQNPNIFSEIIELQANGGSGGIQTQISNWPIYIKIAAWCNKNGRDYIISFCICSPYPLCCWPIDLLSQTKGPHNKYGATHR